MEKQFLDEEFKLYRNITSMFKRSQENWYPCHKIEWGRDGIEVVEVNLQQLESQMGKRLGKWRISIWGADDFGMEREFDQQDDARKIFALLCSSEYIPTQRHLLDNMGFSRA